MFRRRGGGGARATGHGHARPAGCFVDRGWGCRWHAPVTGRRAPRTRWFFPGHAYSPATWPPDPMTAVAVSAEVVIAARAGMSRVGLPASKCVCALLEASTTRSNEEFWR